MHPTLRSDIVANAVKCGVLIATAWRRQAVGHEELGAGRVRPSSDKLAFAGQEEAGAKAVLRFDGALPSGRGRRLRWRHQADRLGQLWTALTSARKQRRSRRSHRPRLVSAVYTAGLRASTGTCPVVFLHIAHGSARYGHVRSARKSSGVILQTGLGRRGIRSMHLVLTDRGVVSWIGHNCNCTPTTEAITSA